MLVYGTESNKKEFLLNEDLTLGIDIAGHYTFTDYLDDVSDTYADYNELAFTGLYYPAFQDRREAFFAITSGRFS